MQIELIPALNKPNIEKRLEKLFSDCSSFIGCVAFWSTKRDYLDYSLQKALQKPNSFLCFDIQLPTNIDNIFEYYQLGVREIYLHQYRQSPSEYSQNTNLLHSKIYLFFNENENVEIWIGSHNLTKFAISGLNLEASISIKCKLSDKICQDVIKYLHHIKNDYCIKFDPQKIDIYKKLQSRDAEKTDENIELQNVVTLFGSKMDTLEKEEIIQLLSLNHKEYSKFKVIGELIYLHAFDLGSHKEYLYKCSIEQSGHLDEGVDKLKLEFTTPRRFAYLGTGSISYLRPEEKINDAIIAFSKYFVNLSITRELKEYNVYSKPTNDEFSFWQNDIFNPYVNERMRNGNQKDYKIQKANFDLRIPKKEVNLSSDVSRIRNKLFDFYEQLEASIMREYSLAKSLNNTKTDELLVNFLESISKDKNLKLSTKSIIERIIIERNSNINSKNDSI